MNVDDLIAEAKRHKTAPAEDFSHADLSEFLRFALEHLLEDLDYEANQESGGAIAARVMAGLIIAADELTARAN